MKVGDTLPALTIPAISGATLTLFACASGGRDSVNIDADQASGTGPLDVTVPGMVSMAYLARFLTAWFDQARLRHFTVRFIGLALVGDEISCSGEVTELFDAGCERRARLEIAATNQFGERRIVGEAVVSL